VRADATRAEAAAPGLAEAEVASARVQVAEKQVAVTRAEGLAQVEVTRAQAVADVERLLRGFLADYADVLRVDASSLRLDPELGTLAAERRCPVILMHNRSRPQDARFEERLGGRYVGARYDDLLEDVPREMMELADAAMAAGVAREQIVLDPGIGFGKTVEQNLTLIRRFDRFKELGFPVLCGPSRKSFIGYTLDLPPEERVEGTAAAVAVAIARGADIVRVHDVKPMARVARMCDAILRR